MLVSYEYLNKKKYASISTKSKILSNKWLYTWSIIFKPAKWIQLYLLLLRYWVSVWATGKQNLGKQGDENQHIRVLIHIFFFAWHYQYFCLQILKLIYFYSICKLGPATLKNYYINISTTKLYNTLLILT